MESFVRNSDLADIYEKVLAKERLSFKDGVRLYQSKDLLTTGYMANLVRERKHGNKTYYVLNLHINPTNVCVADCGFCSFARKPSEAGGYTMALEDIANKVRASLAFGVIEYHIVGGHNPYLPFEFILDIIRTIKQGNPKAHVKAWTMAEIEFFSQIYNMEIEEVLRSLKTAGVDSLPGGGAEIFAKRVRDIICPNKVSGENWIRIAKIAHRLGLPSNATMLYGHVETIEERVEHLLWLREAQDETHGFLSFIPLAYHPENNALQGKWTTGFDDIKNIAVGRLMLDNFDHVKSYWVMMSPKITQVALRFGANDIDGTVMEEKIYHMAGAETEQESPKEELISWIRSAGREPIERDTLYRELEVAA